jgi:DNA mismatch endonuclease, patch repair protein
MADVMTVHQRSRVMSRNRGKDTSPERYLTHLLEAAGLRFVRHDASLHGKPDFVFQKAKVAVFVDGDFWHGWRFPVWKHRLAPFWHDKIAKNRARDQRNFRKLRREGWTVMRLWEHQVEEDLLACVRRVADAVGAPVNWLAVAARRDTLPPLKRRKRLPRP